MAAPILTASGVSKRFGPVQALQNVAFHVAPGEVHALLGINGAGKSTFIKILSGIIQKDGGQITVGGEEVHFRTPEDAIRAGIATVQQHPELVPDMTGLDNIFLGRESARRGLFSRIDQRGLERRAKALLSRFPVALDLTLEVGRMSAVEREAVAILQAIAGENTRVLILDEPTSTLTDIEREDLFALMGLLKAQGIAIIYITHQLEEVFAIADSFSIFRNGTCVARMTVDEAKAGRVSLADLMLGEAIGDIFPPRAATAPGDAVLEVGALCLQGDFDGISLTARKGEVLGIFGLVGSGCDELAKAIFGVTPPDSGTLRLRGQVVRLTSPRAALDAGVFLVPGDRRTEGLVLSRAALFNVPLANLRRAAAGRWSLRRRRMQGDARALTGDVALHPPSLTTPASGFSGGNQQKIVLAKGLYSQADVYIFVEPTVGVDIGARAKIYALMRQLSRDAAVIVISSDCDEVHGVADRTLALHKGRQVEPVSGVFSRDALLMAGIMGEVAQ
ncbi:sugar ABC transporter ATP-binding protein [Pseudotabrizicola alkalilacus]|uniref:Sugar ABC transporter ATP-binding protein n=1 Tax=Pseudotabrizicola alkalilacus TaxID=2305252 RepID=A0A411YWA9_9RHOB|nr:sugar ABC transporter ATP-binding protein [Pseudotabrizicola alkalilacus]RGP35177.1 sugar ABC transporter ATP-binding protein [Pseudotabrizicola alkalilacus]